MAEAKRTERLTKRAVDAAKPAAQRYILWDSDLSGFGIRVFPSGVKSFIAFYRAGTGRKAPMREYAIGRFGTLTAEQARTEAERILSTARLGADPQADKAKVQREVTIAQL